MFDDRPHWLTLQRNWRMQVGASLLLPVALVWLLGEQAAAWEEAALPLFIAGMALIFLSLWRFPHYKRALMHIEATREADDDTRAEAWSILHRQQLNGMLVAKLPGWAGMLHFLCTADTAALVLLVLASQAVLLLYRPPGAWVRAARQG